MDFYPLLMLIILEVQNNKQWCSEDKSLPGPDDTATYGHKDPYKTKALRLEKALMQKLIEQLSRYIYLPV